MKGLTTGLSLCLVVANASAGDMGEGVPELWAGSYFGVHAGAGAGTVTHRTNTAQSFYEVSIVPGVETFTQYSQNFSYAKTHGSVNGSLADLFIGYNFHNCNFVYGAQLEGTLFSDIVLKSFGQGASNDYVTTLTTSTFAPTTTTILATNGSSTFEQLDELRSMFSFIARGGYLARENALLYALGGVVEGHFVTPAAFDLDLTAGRRGLWATGGAVGGGAEYKFTEHLSFLAEYRFMFFNYNRNVDTANLTTGTDGGIESSIVSDSIAVRANFNLGQFGIVYRC